MRLAHKILNRLRREVRHASAFVRAQMFDTMPSDDDVLAAWHGNPPSLEACLREWLDSKPVLFREDLDPTSWNRDGILREADLILQGRTRILGKECDLTRPNLWHEDPLTRKPWPSDVHFTRFNVFHPSRDGVTDIRRLWELGRFGWALPLARAHVLTCEEKYADAWRAHITDFIRKNPPEFGPHWLNAMEAALRAIQWCRAQAIILSVPQSHHPSSFILHPSLLAHARYIRNHLEWTPYGRTNHYIADLVGLLAIGTFVPQFREAEEWRTFSRHQLEHEMEIQTDADGFHAEASTAYHHFVVELYSLAESIEPRFRAHVDRMRQADAAVRGPENLDPQIGDDDSGSLEISNFRSQISEPGSPISNPPSPILNLKSQISNAASGSAALAASGIHILRSDILSCHIACGPNGQQGVGGHAHNDKLSVVIRVHGRPVIIDSGTCCYSADTKLRDAFRSTARHNTLMVDDEEQNPLDDWRMLRDRTRARGTTTDASETETVFCGEHHGYEHLGVIHRRTVFLEKKIHRLACCDVLLSKGAHRVTFRLHLHPRITRNDIRIDSNRVVLPDAELNFEKGHAVGLVDTTCSPTYGAQVPNLALQLHCETKGDWLLAWEVRARANGLASESKPV